MTSLFLGVTLACWPEIKVGVVIDIGHKLYSPGAISCTGKPEYSYNLRMAHELDNFLNENGVKTYLINPELELLERARKASKFKNAILISIHHDSVQPQYLRNNVSEGRNLRYCNQFSGYSIFISNKNSEVSRSNKVAHDLSNSLQSTGLNYSKHHNEDINGERKEFALPENGVYYYDDLIILKHTQIPAILLECGIIVNQVEEKKINQVEYRNLFFNSILSAISQNGV